MTQPDHIESTVPYAGQLEMNASSYRFHPVLDPAADLIDAGDHAGFTALPERVQDLAGIHKDFRDQYRAAVRAGVIADNRSAPSA